METAFDFKREIRRNSFALNGLVIVPTRDLVMANGQEHPLEPLVMDLLCILAERPGEVMMREELIGRLWDIDHGGDENLTRAVSVLRKTLREAGTQDEYIETIPKRGYRLTHPISVTKTSDSELGSPITKPYSTNKGSLVPAMLVILIVSVPLLIIAAIGN